MTTTDESREARPGLAEQATAIHEAGHAVMAYVLRSPFTNISIVPDDDSYGRVKHADVRGNWLRPDIEMNARIRNWLETRIMVLQAGAETERAWYRRQPDPPADWAARVLSGCEGDEEKAVEAASYMCGPRLAEMAAYLEWLRQRVLGKTGYPASDAEREHRDAGGLSRIENGDPLFWALTEALATALIDARALSWRKARKVLDDAQSRYFGPVPRYLSAGQPARP